MPSVVATGEMTTAKRGTKPFTNGVVRTTTAASTSLQQHQQHPPPPPPEQEHLPCPRCDSTNTKFCYYNNYNFSQPRHFCKSCRRYWTQGGTLRDIPVGGGTRRSAKRCRTSITTNAAAAAPSTATTSSAVGSPVSSAGFEGKQGGTALQYDGGDDQVGNANFLWALGGPLGLGLDGKGNGPGSLCGSFTSLLSNTGPGLGSGGLLMGFEDMGFGLGRAIWPLHGLEDGGGAAAAAGGNNTGGGSAVGAVGMTGGNPWQFENGFLVGGGGSGGDCLSWPDLSISTLGNGLK